MLVERCLDGWASRLNSVITFTCTSLLNWQFPYIIAKSYYGTITISGVVPGDRDDEIIQEAHFVPRGEMNSISVSPEILKDYFWDDLGRGF